MPKAIDTIRHKTSQTLAALGVGDEVTAAFLWLEIKQAFNSDLARASEQGNWEQLRDEWMRSEAAVVNELKKNWEDPAPPNLKSFTTKELQNLRAYIGIRLGIFAAANTLVSEAAVTNHFQNLRVAFDREAQECTDEVDLGVTKTAWLGRRFGVLKLIVDQWLKLAPPETKRLIGAELNRLKLHIESKVREDSARLDSGADEAALARERVDLSLPGVVRPVGSRHLVRQVFQEIEDIFVSIGFSVVEGPEIETPYYNFEALNIPEFHPVRDDMDTFYLDLPKGAPNPLLLRTHTSPVQVRTMEQRQPPVRVIVPGKVYRRDNPDATHSFMFHQIEGLAVDAGITFCDFTGAIDYFVKQFFGAGVKTRFRPSYFPFTEPSVEFDASCPFCGGSGAGANGAVCGKCKGAGWIELFGAGMVDPAVYGFVNYDAKKVSGFAFGIGIDRLAMLKYGIDDIQAFFQNDVRFLRQFP